MAYERAAARLRKTASPSSPERMCTMLCHPLTSKMMKSLPLTSLPVPNDESAMKPRIPTINSTAPNESAYNWAGVRSRVMGPSFELGAPRSAQDRGGGRQRERDADPVHEVHQGRVVHAPCATPAGRP